MDRNNAEHLLVSRCDGLLEADAHGEVIGLHIENGTCYGFNETASRVWRLVEQPKTMTEICATLTAEFYVARLKFVRCWMT